MDEFKCCDLLDAAMLANKLNDGENIVFSFSIASAAADAAADAAAASAYAASAVAVAAADADAYDAAAAADHAAVVAYDAAAAAYAKHKAYVMMIVSDFEKIGILPFGGNPNGCFYVGILMRGFFHLDFNQGEKHADDIGEKLGLTNEHDANHVTDMLNEIINELSLINRK